MKQLPERDELWMAYLDGEMSAAEAAAFDASLSEADRGRAQLEMRLEAALAARLSAPCPCPEATWQATLAQLKASKPRSWWHVERPWQLAAAAMLAIGAWGATLAMNYDGLFVSTPDSPLAMQRVSVDQLAKNVTVKGDVDAVQAFLNENKLGVQLHAVDDKGSKVGHKLSLLGAGMETHGGMSVPVVYFDCCGEPAKVVLMHSCNRDAGSPAYDICDAKQVGEFSAIAVSKHHHASRTLALFDKKDARAA